MRLGKLELLAFGPFSGLSLDLSSDGLHVIYGKNEAGKSTTLRAIAALLYGIPRNTEDAHVHRMPDLRIGGVLSRRDGTSLSVVRRKGRDNTLLDRAGQPLDEAVLGRMLGGVSEEQFLTMFGLDHVTLRSGGQALLLGKGHVGESLFAAAMAGGELHKVLRSLRAEADALYSPKAHTRSLNEALRAFTEAQKKTRQLSTSPESVPEQTRVLEELEREREKCDADGRKLRVERAELERTLRVLPQKGRRRALDERRRALGKVVLLAGDAAIVRVDQQRWLASALAEGERLELELAELTARQARLSAPESLTQRPEMPVDWAHRLGALQKGARELGRVRAEIEDLEAQAQALLDKIGDGASFDTAGAKRLPAPTQAKIRQLALDLSATAQSRKDTRRALAQKETRLSATRQELALLPPPSDHAALKKAASRAEREGPLENRLAECQARAARLETTAQAELSTLDLVDCPLDRAVGLPLPSPEAVERAEKTLDEADREARRAVEESRVALDRADQLGHELEALRRTGSIPSEADLAAARHQRDATFGRLVLEVGHGQSQDSISKPQQELALGVESLVARYRDEVKQADDLSDRLRREAERAHQLATLLGERDRAAHKQADAAKRAEASAAARAAAWQAFRDLFRRSGIEPRPPSEARSWLARHAGLVQTFEQLVAARAEASSISASIERHKEALRELLGAPQPPSIGLEALLDRAAAATAAAETLASRRGELERDAREAQTEVDELSSAVAEQERVEARLLRDWRAAVAPLGLGIEPTPTEVTVVMDLLTEALHKIDEAESARRRALAIDRDARCFAEDVQAFVAEHAPDLAGVAPEKAAEEIMQRALWAQSAMAERREIDRQIDLARDRLAGARERASAAATRLAESMREANVDSIEALALAEQRSEEARRLDAQVAEIDGELAAVGESALEDAGSIDAIQVRFDEVEAELTALEQRASVIHQRLGSYKKGLEQLARSDASAADAAAEAEAALARVRELAQRYVRAKVGAAVLAREIEGYRVLHQGPVLARASELFCRMTLGSFAELRTEFDDQDQPVLAGARDDGEAVGIAGMSEGTRDQLFLALRLATLERYAETNEPLPVVLDDILIHFDDDRARAALVALGELSHRGQVLFFTHHARLVELAQGALRSAELFVHELPSPRPAPEPVAAAARTGRAPEAAG